LLPTLDEDKAVVKTLMRLGDGVEIPVGYRMHATDGGWKIWDVVARGGSYVKIYRADLGAIAGTDGVGALNDWLDSQQRRQSSGDRTAGPERRPQPYLSETRRSI